MLNSIRNIIGQQIAMDLGTANTLLYTRGNGIVINEPSVVALETRKNTVLAVGRAAKDFVGRTPHNIRAIRPMKDGVIADFDITREMISYFVSKTITGFHLFKPLMVICVPTGITQVEKRAVIDSAMDAGARKVLLVEEPMAAALGAGMPVCESVGNMVIDVGGGTTEVAVMTLSAIANAESVRVAGDAMDQAILQYMKDMFCMEIGENTAENVKIMLGTAMPIGELPAMEVPGKDTLTGTPKLVSLTEGHVREALREPVQAILSAVMRTIEKTPTKLLGDIREKGILLAGGGALLRGLDQRISKECGLPVMLDPDPLTTVLRGTAKAMENKSLHSSVFIN